jgi:energy-coupling factor transporter ATP-binding protein EcfA2
MSLQKLELNGLRGFATLEELPFAIPNGKHGSGLTTLVGPNNGGKSTIVEALRALAAPSAQNPPQPRSFTEGRRNKRAGDRIMIRATDSSGNVGGLRSVESGTSTSETEWFPAQLEEQIFVLPSRRYFDPLFHKNAMTRDNYIVQYDMSSTARGGPLQQFGSRLFQVQKKRAEFDAVLEEVVNPVPKWAIDRTDSGQYYLKVETSCQYHSSEGLGEGLVSLLIIVDALYDSSLDDVIVIDEPELSLHPSLQRRLFTLLSKYAADRQIVIATHSPYFVDFNALLNGARIARLHLQDGSSVVSTLGEPTIKRLAGFISNYNNPHILGLDAREAFFLEDRVILVEGQEDVIFYQQIADQLEIKIDGNFFGWGVGGAENMETVASLLRELGFKKVVGLLDGNRDALASKLQGEFLDYRFYAIPADDIRTKSSRQIPAVQGILDDKGEVRPEHQEAMTKLLTQVNNEL